MPAYVVSVVNVKDPEQYQEYAKLAPAAVAKFGGRFLARGGIDAVLEGGLGANRLVVTEFPSAEQAKAFYHSPEYQAARQHRVDAADFTMMLCSGL
ncbi:MAG TPA: DUF1330 domain-containing protein [Stellaceae bacterium]|nr:DUF1330 domain-containing protein [Stellaceae bacterium]